MDLSLSEEQEALRDAVARMLDKTSSPEAVRAVEPGGFSESVWNGLVAMGVPTMGVPDIGDASLADLGVVAEQAGAHIAPAPIVEALVANRLLARFDQQVGDETIATIALRPSLNDRFGSVPGAAVATKVLGLHNGDLVLADNVASDATVNLGSAPLADVGLSATEVSILSSGEAAEAAFAQALDEWQVLTAAWFVGHARAAMAIGLQYAKDRQQFGVAVGSFQALQHRFADLATDLDGADLLTAKALWALDSGDPVAGTFPPMAFAWAGSTAERVSSFALHVHGGYGFMEEYDIQLYFRRAKGTRLLLGDPRRQLQRVADRLFAPGAPRTGEPARSPDNEQLPTGVGRNFRLGPDVETFRDEVREFLSANVTDEVVETAHRTGTIHDWGLHHKMAEQGWLSAGWPEEYGGQGRSPLEMNALTEEMYLSGAPVDGLGVSSLVAHTLLLDGTEWQKTTIIPELISGQALCCLGYSEPDAGSDVAACSTRAVRDGDEWRIDGQKMFTTLAHESRYVFLLTRTNLDVAKHKGLTMFVVPMDTPGIEISPVHTMGGERTNITFYSDVRVNDRYRVGEIDGGWSVMMTALVFERNSAWYGECVRLLDQAVDWARSTGDEAGSPLINDPLIRERLVNAAIGNEISNLLGWRAAWMAANGVLPGVEGTMSKLFTTEHYQRAGSDLIDILGSEGLRRHGDPHAPADGWIEATYRHCQVTTIYGGTSEVCRNVIAERGLGLPRNR